MTEIAQLLKMIFRPNDMVGLKEHKKDGSSGSRHLDHAIQQAEKLKHELVFIHPFEPTTEFIMTDCQYQDFIFATQGDYDGEWVTRSTCSEDTITSYGQFLIEIDPDPNYWAFLDEIGKNNILDLQKEFIESLSIPYACITFSGNKSIHCLISIKDPSLDKDSWKDIRRWLIDGLESKFNSLSWRGLSDRCTLDIPSYNAGFRLPGVLRKDTNRTQKVLGFGGQVSLRDLQDWLSNLSPRPIRGKTRRTWVSVQLSGGEKRMCLTPHLKKLVLNGSKGSQPENGILKLAGSLFQQRWSQDEIQEVIELIEGVEILDMEVIEDLVAKAQKWSQSVDEKKEGLQVTSQHQKSAKKGGD